MNASTARAALLLRHVDTYGWTIEFFSTSDNSAVHVIAPDHYHPRREGVAENLLFRHWFTICGRYFRTSALDGALNSTFTDTRLCALCHKAFPAPDGQAVIFAHNTTDYQDWAATSNASIRTYADLNP